jgi:hypothetical protein
MTRNQKSASIDRYSHCEYIPYKQSKKLFENITEVYIGMDDMVVTQVTSSRFAAKKSLTDVIMHTQVNLERNWRKPWLARVIEVASYK